MTEAESRKEDILRKVRGLLAKANATPFEAEADVFRKKADELMTAYAIEEWQLAQADPSKRDAKPIRKDIDFTWYYNDDLGKDALWPLFLALATHCRCVVANKHVTSSREGIIIPVFGTPSDLDYLDLVFTDLMIQMSSKFKPVYNPQKSDGENIYVAKEAGMSWKDIAVWIGRPELIKYKADGNTVASISGYLKAEYRKWGDATGKDWHSANPKTYVRSFAMGFTRGVTQKLQEMRGEQGQETGSMALAIIDMREQAKEEMFNEFPDQAKQSMGRYRQDNRRTDPTALVKGTSEGKNARIAGKGDRGMSHRKELN